ncbi:MAG: DUF6620 family protein [Polyangiaceae bacterium]
MGFFDSIKKSVQGAVGQVQQQVQPQQHQPPPQQQQQYAAPPPPAPEPEEVMEPGEFKRDYDLEARDDAASFNLQNDLGGYYVAEFRIEQNWDDLPQRYSLLKEYGVRNEQHYYQVKATVERFIQSPFATQKWGGIGEIMHVKMKATQDFMMGGMQNKLQGELKGEIEPVEGISLDQWASSMVKIVNQKPLDQILAGLGIDQAKWDRVSAEWNARMSRDTTATIATAYGKAFTNSSANEGKFGSAAQNPGQGNPPIPLEQYIEVMEAQNAGANQGKDASQILQSFGLSILDWSNLGSWFSAYFNENALKNDGALHKQWTSLQEKYAAKYKSGSADSDIKF